jgi:putative ABC transport system permease protein
VNLPVMSYGKTDAQVSEFYREVKERVSALPGVEQVAEGFNAPWRGEQDQGFSLQFAAKGAHRQDGKDEFRAQFRSVSPGFFATMGVPIVEGRDFNGGDKEGNERVVIISQSLANELFPGQSAVDRTLWWTDGVIKFIGISGEPRRIVAVVPDFDDENIIPAPAKTIYQPIDQEGINGKLFVRAHRDAYALVPAITALIHKMSADQPVERAATLGDVRAEVLTPDKLNAIVFGGFAGIALLISIVGVAGVLAFSVSGRTREFGIRIALGAQPANILTDVLLDGLLMAAIGVAAGLVLGVTLTRLAASYISAVDQPGALALGASAFVILAAAVIASAVPAARAARVNAVEALRAE